MNGSTEERNFAYEAESRFPGEWNITGIVTFDSWISLSTAANELQIRLDSVTEARYTLIKMEEIKEKVMSFDMREDPG